MKLDGTAIGTTPIRQHEVLEGRHTVEIDDPCVFSKGKRFTLKRGATKVLDLKTRPRQGAIKVTAEDDRGNALSAQVRVDGAVVSGIGMLACFFCFTRFRKGSSLRKGCTPSGCLSRTFQATARSSPQRGRM